ncbi:carbonic anhydrase [Streptomyces coeruleorubidus]|uniref:carbonic anhydrase n=1 Tax=Streptomyces coeruleorubidus TaxID=116188 RepID=UPI00237F75BC|nr:carbonic anhydrase [Streptomyces coeruleorubidus]WDV53288.1 carbonic anhydrase [Streptomyces coeruleorubidus]
MQPLIDNARLFGQRPKEFTRLVGGHTLPPYATATPAGEMAAIEYAAQELSVKSVVVRGHSHCGPDDAVVRRNDLSAEPALCDRLVREHHAESGTFEMR